MSDLFDDMPDLFTDPDAGFGEEITYVSSDTGQILTINGVWTDKPILQGMVPMSDAPEITVDVRTVDVSNPAETDEVTRVKTGVTYTVVNPIQPDHYGMTRLTLQKIDE